jgi:hypothetical protein
MVARSSLASSFPRVVIKGFGRSSPARAAVARAAVAKRNAAYGRDFIKFICFR